jgi:hypothetical protein
MSSRLTVETVSVFCPFLRCDKLVRFSEYIVPSVTLLNAEPADGSTDSVPVALVAVGALLVGSISWTKTEGEKVAKGENVTF